MVQINKIAKIGNVEFTETGVRFEKSFTERPEFERVPWSKIEPMLIQVIKNRIEHCEKRLNDNIHKATIITPEQIIWDGGRFSKLVYEAMVMYVENPRKNLTSLIMQQALREMFLNRNQYDRSWNIVFMILSEMLLCNVDHERFDRMLEQSDFFDE